MFSGLLEFPDEEEDIEKPQQTQKRYFYLYSHHEEVFKLFQILRDYFTPDGGFDSALLIELVKKKGLDLESILLDLPLLRYGYFQILYPPKEDK